MVQATCEQAPACSGSTGQAPACSGSCSTGQGGGAAGGPCSSPSQEQQRPRGLPAYERDQAQLDFSFPSSTHYTAWWSAAASVAGLFAVWTCALSTRADSAEECLYAASRAVLVALMCIRLASMAGRSLQSIQLRQAAAPAAARASTAAASAPPGRGLSCDVFIPCYREDVETVANTVNAALAADVPADIRCLTVHVCDDGRDPHKQELFQRYAARTGADGVPRSVVYLAHGHHGQQKGGNLNAALAVSSGDLILTLDADMECLPDCLCQLYTALSSATGASGRPVAFVQTPQRFHDVPHGDPFASRNLEWFERTVMHAGHPAWGAAPFIGTGALFWRKALVAVGGFDVGQVSEDVQTASELHMAGYDSHWLPLIGGAAVGESPQDGTAFLKQRTRWAWGSMTLFCTKCPLTKPGYSPLQRLFWVGAMVHYLVHSSQQLLECAALSACIGAALLGGRLPRMAFFSWDLMPLLVAATAAERVLYFSCRDRRSSWVLFTDYISSRWMVTATTTVWLWMLARLAGVLLRGESLVVASFAETAASAKAGSKAGSGVRLHLALIAAPGALWLGIGLAGAAHSLLALDAGDKAASMLLMLSWVLASCGVRHLWFWLALVLPPATIQGEHGYAAVSGLRHYWFRLAVDLAEMLGIPLLWAARHGFDAWSVLSAPSHATGAADTPLLAGHLGLLNATQPGAWVLGAANGTCALADAPLHYSSAAAATPLLLPVASAAL